MLWRGAQEFLKSVGYYCREKWKTEAFIGVVAGGIIGVFRHRHDTWDVVVYAILAILLTLGAYVAAHIVRTAVHLHALHGEQNNISHGYVWLGFVVVVGLILGFAIICMEISRLPDHPVVVARRIKRSTESQQSTRQGAKYQTKFTFGTTKIFTGGLNIYFQCDHPLIDGRVVDGSEYHPLTARKEVSDETRFIFGFVERAPFFGPDSPIELVLWANEPINCGSTIQVY